MSKPITVLMSVYNSKQWIELAIESILHQTFTDFDFLIINDGSNDGSLEIINKFAKLDSRIKVLSKINTGLTDSLNYGLQSIETPWVARIDADDFASRDRLKEQYQFVLNRRDVVLLGSYFSRVDQNGHKLHTYKYPVNHNQLVRNLKQAKSFFPHSSAFFSLKAASSVGLYRKYFTVSQDWDLWLRLSKVGKFSCVDKDLVSVRNHPSQISNICFGDMQLLFSRKALLFSKLSDLNVDDPINSDQEDLFDEWFESSVEINYLRKYSIFIRRFKNILSKRKLTSEELKLFMNIKVILFIASFIKQIFLGETLSDDLAFKWINIRR